MGKERKREMEEREEVEGERSGGWEEEVERWREKQRERDGERQKQVEIVGDKKELRDERHLFRALKKTDLPNRGGFCSCLCFTKQHVVKRFVVNKDILSEFSPHFRFAELVLF